MGTKLGNQRRESFGVNWWKSWATGENYIVRGQGPAASDTPEHLRICSRRATDIGLRISFPDGNGWVGNHPIQAGRPW